MKRSVYFIFLLLIGSIGCLDKVEYPDQPRIESIDFIVMTDSANMLINFTDGDGNFGLKDGEFTDPSDCPKNYNVFLEYYEKQNGDWVWVDLNPCTNPNALPFYYRVPFAEPSGQFKAQKGEIKIAMNAYYLQSEYDTFRFEVRMTDFDQNVSNVILTNDLVKPE